MQLTKENKIRICVTSNKHGGAKARIVYHVRKFNPELDNAATKGQFTDLKEMVEAAISKVNSLRWVQNTIIDSQADLYTVARSSCRKPPRSTTS